MVWQASIYSRQNGWKDLRAIWSLLQDRIEGDCQTMDQDFLKDYSKARSMLLIARNLVDHPKSNECFPLFWRTYSLWVKHPNFDSIVDDLSLDEVS